VISPVQIWAKLPINGQSILPGRFWVFAARLRVNLFIARLQVNLYAAHSWVKLCPTHLRVKQYATHLWVTLYDTHLRVPAHLWVNLFVSRLYDTCLWMPAHSHVNLHAACLQVNLYVAQPWVGLYDCLYAVCPEVKLYVAPLQVNLNATYPQVNLHLLVNQTTNLWANMYYIFKLVDQCAGCEWEKQYAHWVDNKQNILLACFNMCNLLHFEESHISVWRDSIIQYSVADHPFFVFHPKLVDCSDFGETVKMYAQYLQQYQLVRIIEFVLQWCNHWCHFISKHACILVNLDLTPQQHCQRARTLDYVSITISYT
jgi:hypothetical protein